MWNKTWARNTRDCGFTLVELLVVIGIIAALISILLPVLANVGYSARNVKCQSNLRQIAMWGLMYATDNRGYLPSNEIDAFGTTDAWSSVGKGTWFQKADVPYRLWTTDNTKSVFRCPEAMSVFPAMRGNGLVSTYAVNAYLGGQRTGYKVSSTAKPDAPEPRIRLLKASCYWFTEAGTYFQAAEQAWGFRSAPFFQNSFYAGQYWPWTWDHTVDGFNFRGHPKKMANFVFGDAHVESVSRAQFAAMSGYPKQQFLAAHYTNP